MKVGDLVRHPRGMRNVCKNSYSAGILLEMEGLPNVKGSPTRCLVLWGDGSGPFVYAKRNLEVVNAVR